MCYTVSYITSTPPCSIMRGRTTFHTLYCAILYEAVSPSSRNDAMVYGVGSYPAELEAPRPASTGATGRGMITLAAAISASRAALPLSPLVATCERMGCTGVVALAPVQASQRFETSRVRVHSLEYQ